MTGGDPLRHPSTWGNPRAEQALRRLHRMEVPEVSARTMRKRLRGIPAAVPPIDTVTGKVRAVRQDAPKLSPRQRAAQFADPHDWRWFVGGLGKVLISIGILIFAFVAYQLWGTGIQYARAQDKLEDQFNEQLAEVSGSTTAPAPASTLAQVTPGSDATSVPDDPGTLASVDPSTEVPTTTAATTTAARVELPPLSLGDVLGKIEIPSIGVEDMIVAGVRQSDLDKGVGHYPYTPLPGDPGNVAIAGHRTTHGQPFFNLDKLAAGDEIVVTTLEGRFVYVVQGSKVVDPSDFSVLLGNPDESQLTLTTCHPRYSQKKRLVVSALLDPSLSTTANADITYSSEALAPEATADPSVSDTIAGDSGAAPTDTSSTSGAPAADTSAGREATADAFAEGWFDDPDAWPQIALWGFGLTAVALAATFLGRRTRNWIGALAGIAPFVVLLYFWFENVNRLLPPGL